MLKIVTICTILVLALKSEEETVEITLINYDAMYNNECASSDSSDSSSASSSDDAEGSDSNNGYEHKYDKYYKKYEDKYADKYEDKYQGSSNPGSVTGNEVGGDSANSEKKQSSTFCKCLAEVKKSGKSYSESQNEFSKCIDKANGNDAEHWEKVAKRYQHKYGIKTDSEELPAITTTAKPVSTAVATEGVDNEEDMDGIQSTMLGTDEGGDMLFALKVEDDGDGRFGNAAVFITFIGASLFLFVCAWFVKDGLKKWKMREYQNVKQVSSYESEADADSNGNPYGGNYDDWDDNYDYNFNRNNKSEKKGKFGGWNQYNAV